MKRIALFGAVAWAIAAAGAQPPSPQYDLVIHGGTVVDGTGAPRNTEKQK